jgi:hypothetical protein
VHTIAFVMLVHCCELRTKRGVDARHIACPPNVALTVISFSFAVLLQMSSDAPSCRSSQVSHKRTNTHDDGGDGGALRVSKRRGNQVGEAIASAARASVALSSAADDIIELINKLNIRAAAGRSRCAAGYDSLLTAQDRTRARLLREHRARLRAFDKWIDDKIETTDTAAKQLAAISAMSLANSKHAGLLLHDVGLIEQLAQGVDSFGAMFCVPVSTLALSNLDGMNTLWCALPDSVASSVSGYGMLMFVKGPASGPHNKIVVHARVSSGSHAEYVEPEDVYLLLKDADGSSIESQVTVERVADGGLQLAYAIAAQCVNTLSLSVAVCGVAVGPAAMVKSGYDAINGTSHVATYDLAAELEHVNSIAINTERSIMVVSVSRVLISTHESAEKLSEVRVYRFTPSPEFTHGIGRYGSGPGEFDHPSRMCFIHNDEILVCDSSNRRMQHLTAAGKFLKVFAADIDFTNSVASHGDMVVVGFETVSIRMFSLASGDLTRIFESVNCIEGDCMTGIRFSPDGERILAASYNAGGAVMFTVDGRVNGFVGTRGLIPHDGWNDVEFGAGGEIIITDSIFRRICVFSPDAHTYDDGCEVCVPAAPLKTWGAASTSTGKIFSSITAFAVCGLNLYVLDFPEYPEAQRGQPRLQVFQ